MPPEIAEALEVETLAQRYHCTPGAILREPAWLRKHVAIVDMAKGMSA